MRFFALGLLATVLHTLLISPSGVSAARGGSVSRTEQTEDREEDQDGFTMTEMAVVMHDLLARVALLEGNNAVLEERILSLETERNTLQHKLEEMETELQQSTDKHLQQERRLQDSCITQDTKSGGSLYFEGCNIHIRNGNGGTDRINSYGNLIVGYNEADSSHSRSGSHNIVVGSAHDWRSHSGIVSGRSNDINGGAAVAIGGHNNVVDGGGSTCIGGSGNVVRTGMGNNFGGAANVVAGLDSVVVGGSSNTAQAQSSVVIGGKGNVGSVAFGVTVQA